MRHSVGSRYIIYKYLASNSQEVVLTEMSNVYKCLQLILRMFCTPVTYYGSAVDNVNIPVALIQVNVKVCR